MKNLTNEKTTGLFLEDIGFEDLNEKHIPLIVNDLLKRIFDQPQSDVWNEKNFVLCFSYKLKGWYILEDNDNSSFVDLYIPLFSTHGINSFFHDYMLTRYFNEMSAYSQTVYCKDLMMFDDFVKDSIYDIISINIKENAFSKLELIKNNGHIKFVEGEIDEC